MAGPIKALVVDDDIWSLRMITGMLAQCFPDIAVEAREEPDCSGDFDIYFIDNDFNGRPLAKDLAIEIRQRDPDALVVAVSSKLDSDLLRELINLGCNGACDKSVAGDMPRAMEIVGAFIETRARMAAATSVESSSSGGLVGTINSIRGLLREWNQRLEQQEVNEKAA